jgi:hypothetical protein
MMKQILLSVALMVETAVCLMLLKIIAQNALVIIKRPVLLDFFLHQLEMAIVMMIQILLTVVMMEETAVDPASALITAQIVLALEI